VTPPATTAVVPCRAGEGGPATGQAVDELSCLEICAGLGGEALGLEQAGFTHKAVVEFRPAPCRTLRLNRRSTWNIVQDDIRNVHGGDYAGVALLAGGVPCSPFTEAGKQLGQDDDRDMVPQALRLVEETGPRAVFLENVKGLATPRFGDYRAQVLARLSGLGYQTWWDLVYARDHGVPQLRPRFVLVAIRQPWAGYFRWPVPSPDPPPTVGQALHDLMGVRGWPGADAWRDRAASIAPTLVGGSEKHGGADLGPVRAKRAWADRGVNGLGIADEPPGPDFPSAGMPMLTVRMAARIQAIPDDWAIAGRKTAAYRQVGNALPPPVARAFGLAIRNALEKADPSPANGSQPGAARIRAAERNGGQAGSAREPYAASAPARGRAG
jgi:DNA (cytosine-5)-methyltransferase 1